MVILVMDSSTSEIERQRAIRDLVFVKDHPKMYINQKGYLQKTIDILFRLGYYKINKTIFEER